MMTIAKETTTPPSSEPVAFLNCLKKTARIMRVTHDKGGERLMSIWEEDVQAVEEDAKLLEAHPQPAAGAEREGRPEAEYVKRVVKALRAGHPYSGIVDKVDTAAADLIEALYLATLATPPVSVRGLEEDIENVNKVIDRCAEIADRHSYAASQAILRTRRASLKQGAGE